MCGKQRQGKATVEMILFVAYCDTCRSVLSSYIFASSRPLCNYLSEIKRHFSLNLKSQQFGWTDLERIEL